MTVLTYRKALRKALAGTLIASTFLLSGLLKKAQANTATPHVTEDSLLIHQSNLGERATEASAAINNIVHQSIAGAPDAVSGFSAQRLGLTPDTGSRPAAEVAQAHPAPAVELAQDVAQGTDDTFSPLTEEELRQRLLIDPNATVDVDAPRPVPSSSFLTPSAYGADWGDFYLGVAGAAGGNLRDVDGSASLGVGFGDAVRNVGLEVSASIISLDGFAEDGTVGFKVHKVFPQANNLAVAVGWANPVKWGSANEDEEIFYGVATQRFALRPNRDNQMPLTVSAGVGTGTFRSSGAIAAGDNALNPFGSVSIRVIPQLALTSSWTGSGLGLAASAAPFDFPLIFTAGVSDLTDNTAEGTRFQGSMGYGFSF